MMVQLGCSNPGFGLEAQRVWETLILRADDYGRGKFLPGVIRAEAFGTVPDVFPTVTDELIISWVLQIEKEGAIQIYEHEGDKFYALTGWNRYQRGDWQRGESQLPEPPQLDNSDGTDAEQSATVRTKDKYKSKVKEKSKEKEEREPPPSAYVDFINEIFPDNSFTVGQMLKQCNALGKLIDKYGQEEVCAVLRWGSQDTGKHGDDFPGWKAVFHSVERLIKDGNQKYLNMRGGYQTKEKPFSHNYE
ncbi:hypothetical protein KKE60_04420 [Patescibacteria group bacterium]|nr:hypothetical protein [Patescibacteria group bacterium]